jgi:hypothetical protein
MEDEMRAGGLPAGEKFLGLAPASLPIVGSVRRSRRFGSWNLLRLASGHDSNGEHRIYVWSESFESS